MWSAIDQPTTVRENTSSHDRGVDLAVAGRMLGDVSAPQPVRCVGDEPSRDEIVVHRRGGTAAALVGCADTGQAGGPHQPVGCHKWVQGRELRRVGRCAGARVALPTSPGSATGHLKWLYFWP